MLGYDSEHSQRPLCIRSVKTSFQPIFKFRKMPKPFLFYFAGCCFSKLTAGGYRHHEPYVCFKHSPQPKPKNLNTCQTHLKHKTIIKQTQQTQKTQNTENN